MSEAPKPTFVNNLVINGFLNGVVNLSFSAARWYPVADSDPEKRGQMKVAGTDVIDVDLRMDLFCAQQLRDALNKIIEDNTKPKVTN